MISMCARVCVRWLVPGRKEGSKTWLTVDRRSHQDTSPFLFLSLRFIETRRTIILFFLSRERETSLSLSLLSCPGGEKAFSIAVGTKLWSRNCGARRGKTKSGEESRKNPAADRARPNRRIERDESFSSLSLCPSWTSSSSSSLLPPHVCSLGFLIKCRGKKRRPV